MKVMGKEITFFGYDFSVFMMNALLVLIALAVYGIVTTGMSLAIYTLFVRGPLVVAWTFLIFFTILNIGLLVAEIDLLRELL